MAKKVAFHNLGCKVNSYELDIMRQILQEDGYEEVPFQEKADIYVVNTCTVTNIADRKSRQMLHRARKQNPQAVVIAVGCYVETDPGRVEQDEAVDLVIGNNKKTQIGKILSDFLAKQEPAKPVYREDLTCAPAYENMQLTAPGHTRAYIKIQDGCNQFCSYCIIPYARGRIRSRDEEEILREVQGLVRDGIREIVLTGIHVSSYGLDRGLEAQEAAPARSIQLPDAAPADTAAAGGTAPEEDAAKRRPKAPRFDPERAGAALLGLLRELNSLEGLERIRLSSLEPRIMTEPFIADLAKLEKVCPHFHLSLQSGCDETLRRMNRRYTTAEYARSVRLLRQYYDRPAITTDVIVGFPGETEEEFAATCAFLEQIRFYEIHVFRYSRRNGTAAAKMRGQIPEPVKAVRSDRLLELTAAQADAYRAQFAGEEETLLLEEICTLDGKEYWVGSTKRYVTGAVPVEEARGLAPDIMHTCPAQGQAGEDAAGEAPGFSAGRLCAGTFSGDTLEFSRGKALRFTARRSN